MSNTEPTRRPKIAILGGGVGAITAAFELTDPDNPVYQQQKYEVTIYQLGWRLGGKCASGRSVEGDHPRRIEEHGLHLWFGAYDNAFKLIQKCYAELNRPAGSPLASWDQAFKPRRTTVLMEYVHGKWLGWRHDWRQNEINPGVVVPQSVSKVADPLGTWVKKLSPDPGVGTLLSDLINRASTSPANLATRVVFWWIGAYYNAHLRHPWFREVEVSVVRIGYCFMWGLWQMIRRLTPRDNHLRRLWIMLNFCFAAFRGGVMDDLVGKGFERLNNQDFRQWLGKYAINDGGLMLNSAWMYGLYDACFAYKQGDNTRTETGGFPLNASLAAGTALCIGLRQLLNSKGAVCWEMQAGTGDTIFAPMYEVLKKRGVKFKFFHRVTALHAASVHGAERIDPSRPNCTIDRIDISRQATLRPEVEAAGGYNPLIDVHVDLPVDPQSAAAGPRISGTLPCWPAAPRYEQLAEGEQLKSNAVDLEAFCYDWQDVEQFSLKQGVDFDHVVLGISLGALPYICTDLIDKSNKWKDMVTNLQTTRTMGVQLWMQPTLPQLGWTAAPSPITGAFDESSLNTWADMKHLIDCEGWQGNPRPQSLAYFCGPMTEGNIAPTVYGPTEQHAPDDQKRANELVKSAAVDLLNKNVSALWPNAVEAEVDQSPGGFKWDSLVGPGHAGPTGEARLDTQWIRANIAPSERYVLSVQSDRNYRLPSYSPEEFDNLYLAGDWTDNRMNVGCVEAATMSGMLASYDFCGYPKLGDIDGLPHGVAEGKPAFAPGDRPYMVNRPPAPPRSPKAQPAQAKSPAQPAKGPAASSSGPQSS